MMTDKEMATMKELIQQRDAALKREQVLLAEIADLHNSRSGDEAMKWKLAFFILLYVASELGIRIVSGHW